ncbi:hypothetical protein PRIPAC_83332 [Pristionchus pacificus]|nr:hypothetical protein PRIPAC_83332 [Pristionchus pacificus]
MTSSLQLFIILSAILNSSVAVVNFTKSILYDEIDFATQVVYVPNFCSEGCRIYVSVQEASASIAKNIVVHDYIHDQFSLYDISQQVESDGQKGYSAVDVGNAQVNIINTNLGYATAPLAVWIVRKDATNFGYSRVFEADNLSTAPSSLQVVSIMSAVPFTLRTKTQGSTELISTLTGFDAVNTSEDECIQVITEMDFDTFLDVQTFVQSPLITLFFNDEKRPTTSLSTETGYGNDLDLSGVSFVASPGFIGCKGNQTFRSSLYDDYTSVNYSSYDRSYDVSISSILNNDADHQVTIKDTTNDKEYKLISPGGTSATNITISQTNILDISWTLQDSLSSSNNSFLLRLTPSKETMITPISTTATKPVQHSTTPVSVPSTTTKPAQGSALHSCPSPLILYRDEQCRGYYASDMEYMDDSAGQVISCCIKINAHPVSIHTDEQQDYWSAQKHERYFILGLTCNSRSKHWEWADGSVLDYKPPTFDKEMDSDCNTGCNWYMESDGAWRINCTHVVQETDFFCIAQLSQPTPTTDCGSFIDGSDDSQCYEKRRPGTKLARSVTVSELNSLPFTVNSKTRTFDGWPCPEERSTECCSAALSLGREKPSDGWTDPSGTTRTSILDSPSTGSAIVCPWIRSLRRGNG